jgi:Kef-type K+ transport system membrane component KefB
VNAIWLLMGLLLLSYIGSFLVGGRALRGVGLPSGAEYVVLGFVLGPHVLGLLDRSSLDAFEPVANVSLGWLALVIGLDYGFVQGRRLRASRMALGLLVALITGALIAFAVVAFVTQFTPLRGVERALLAGGVAAACAETTRHAILWVMQRHEASGKISNLIAELAAADDLVPLLGMAVVFAMKPTAGALMSIPFWGWTVITAAIGVVLGGIAVALLGSDFRLIQSWSVLIGTSLLTVGMSSRVGLSPLFATFVMGITIASISRHRAEITAMVAPSERPVLLPALLLAGAHVDFRAAPYLPWIVGIAVVVRVLAKVGLGSLVRLALPDARGSGRLFGFGLLSSGALAMSIGLAFALQFPGPIGDTVLAAAAVVTVFGEFVGPAALRSSLRFAGEITVVEPSSEAAVKESADADEDRDSTEDSVDEMDGPPRTGGSAESTPIGEVATK